MRRATISIIGAVTGMLVAGATSASGTEPTDPLETATVSVSGMTLIPDGVEVTAPIIEASTTFQVTASAKDLDALISKRVAEASRAVTAPVKPRKGGLSTQASHTTFGSCGSSYVVLRSTTSQEQGQGYVEAGFSLSGGTVSNALAYDTDTLLYSNSAADLWTMHLKDSGPDLPGLTWKKGGRVDIPKTQDYGAHFYVGTVKVTTINGSSATCGTKGPRVDNVKLYK